ncbi:MAG: outer membrane lipoprotein-sorting protein [Gammaproteobacteria bacterium]|nr:outer membrane lipoprotein-sorting protein [Gammaproteobacteria bacterium]
MLKRLLWILLLTLPLHSANAKTAEEKGLAIAIEADRRDTGWISQTANMKMELRNKQGQTSIRKIRSRTLEVQGDGDKGLSIFDTPADVKGTAFLSYTHATTADDQWLYLPALKRVKRIASANKSGPFMGSEFAYEDITSQEVARYTYKYLQDEKIEDRDTMVIERYPTYKNSGYTRQIVWIDKKMWQPIKVEFYDRKNARLKTLTFHNYQQYLGQYWRPERMEMVNHQSGKATTLTWSNYKFKTGLTDRDFDKNSLKRIR